MTSQYLSIRSNHLDQPPEEGLAKEVLLEELEAVAAQTWANQCLWNHQVNSVAVVAEHGVSRAKLGVSGHQVGLHLRQIVEIEEHEVPLVVVRVHRPHTPWEKEQML